MYLEVTIVCYHFSSIENLMPSYFSTNCTKNGGFISYKSYLSIIKFQLNTNTIVLPCAEIIFEQVFRVLTTRSRPAFPWSDLAAIKVCRKGRGVFTNGRHGKIYLTLPDHLYCYNDRLALFPKGHPPPFFFTFTDTRFVIYRLLAKIVVNIISTE